MDSRQLIDAQFNRAVEIAQSLPKTGPIQTGYEEKLTIYSLYKQATVGNVTSSRPGMFDMLGRAKWDAWEKHRDLDEYEAKSLYVDALLKALSKYSDKTAARDLMDELRSYGGGSDSSYILTRTASRSSSSSTSTASEGDSHMSAPLGHHDLHHPSARRRSGPTDDSEDGEAADQTRDLPAIRDASQQQRPHSSISSSRYRTPLTGSFAPSSPPRRTSVPPIQPLPSFQTPSAFADPQRAPVTSPSVDTSSTFHLAPLSSSHDLTPQIQTTGPFYRSPPMTYGHSTTTPAHLRPSSRASISMEYAMENMQAHIAALTERIDTLESSLANHSQLQAQSSTSPHASSGRGSPAGSRSVAHSFQWDVDDTGLWALVLKPLSQNLSFLQRIAVFFLTSGQDRSPLQVVVRRLCLDISFLMMMVGVLRTAWKQSGTRRREVGAALIVLWGAATGKRRGRI